jgi:membrane-associated phospholipid phosphatase
VREVTTQGTVYSSSLSPADKVVIAYLVIIAALVVASAQAVSDWWIIIALHAIAIAVIIGLAKIHRRMPASFRTRIRLLRGWYPLVLIPLTYKELTHLIPRIHPRDFDWELAAIDYRLFGVHPTVWMERFTSPLLTEFFQLSYVTYYFMPLVLGVVFWRRGWFDRFQFLLFVLVLGFYLSYLGYIAVPAIGPRFILADQQAAPLAGVWTFDWIRRTLDQAEGITRDCFPSGHVELTLLVLYFAARFHRRSLWWMLPSGGALVVSTVYLRYHYVIDVAAGVLLAVLVIVIAGPLYRLLGGEPLSRDRGAPILD